MQLSRGSPQFGGGYRLSDPTTTTTTIAPPLSPTEHITEPYVIPFSTTLILAVTLLFVTILSGLVPIALIEHLKKKGRDPSKRGWLSYLSCFSGGVFLATCFLGVVPHVDRLFFELQHEWQFTVGFPIPQAIICVGFFLVYATEELIGALFTFERVPLNEQDETNMFKLADENEKLTPPEDHRSVLRALTFAVAISFHSILEGFALGVQDTSGGLISLFLSLLIHKAVEAFSVGIQLSKAGSHAQLRILISTIVIYGLMTPIGSILGAFLQMGGKSLQKDWAMLVLESLAGGTFIYVTFVEIVAHEKQNHFNNFKQLICIGFGFLLICAMTAIFGEA
ncbi:unnamed protein product [Caenorhabditis bovis]|uniref:Uncharacterized protein n=1 Tax=Caenorhabditis bovis TaxID=2654633 RepID=A0A8S1ECP7_9PELO|nr:unnamed protein product [Caenorhabditis bovis]